MQEWFNWFISLQGLTFAFALVIFIVTLVLIIKRFISFIVTLVILAACIGAAYLLIYPDTLHQYFKGEPKEKTTETPLQQSVDQVIKKIDQLKEQYSTPPTK